MKVVIPSSPRDAKGLFTAAMREDDPVVVFAPAALMNTSGDVPEDEVYIPLGSGDIKRSGTDVTVLAVCHFVVEALKVAKRLKEEGISVEVLDPRSLLPFDYALLHSSVSRTGRLIIFDDSNRTCGFAAEVAAYAAESLAHLLKAPVTRIARADVPVPFSTALDKYVLPNGAQLERAIRNRVGRTEPELARG
jgi:pyruvate dehydrogenase E1 component beta subunit